MFGRQSCHNENEIGGTLCSLNFASYGVSGFNLALKNEVDGYKKLVCNYF